MIKAIFIGDEQSNIIQKLMSSKIAKVIFFITCLIVYANSRVVGIPDLIILILKVLIITNILYIPIRLVYSDEIGFGYKGVFTITEVCLLGSYTNTDTIFSLLFLLYYFIVTILVSLIITKFVIYIFKESNIISDTSCYFDKAKNETEEMDVMEGHEFEYYCAELLERNSFINVNVTQGSGDHGIDVLAEKDRILYAIQCKCYSGIVGNKAIQEAYTGKQLYGADIAVVMSNNYFSKQAIEEATRLGVKLWDRDIVLKMAEL